MHGARPEASVSVQSGSVDTVQDDFFDLGFLSEDLCDLFHLNPNIGNVGTADGLHGTSNIANAVHNPHVCLSDIDASPAYF